MQGAPEGGSEKAELGRTVVVPEPTDVQEGKGLVLEGHLQHTLEPRLTERAAHHPASHVRPIGFPGEVGQYHPCETGVQEIIIGR